MKTNALSVANYFIDLARKEETPITQLGLMKRVYAAHGFSLALLGRSLLDERFDDVQAWKYGPVIPSVYHSFKNFKSNPITEKSILMEWDDKKNEAKYIIPELADEEAKTIIEMVWGRYKEYSDSEMVSLTHRDGTPWALCYIPEMNCLIPDSYTQLYYKKLVENIVKSSK